jgi:guanylate kinase
VNVGARGSGILFVVSAPSGTGKSTLVRALLSEVPDVEFSVSYTTRPPREGEVDGVHYHFVDRARFEAMVEREQFVEWAEVYDQLYGTELQATREVLGRGRDLLLDIDVQGARKVRGGAIPSVSVMLLPPDYRTLEARLRERGSESPRARERRLAEARDEARDFEKFDYLVVNDDLTTTIADLASIVRAERRRTLHCRERGRAILATFPA